MNGKKFILFGDKRVPAETIANYELKSIIETEQERAARKKLDVENGIVGGVFKGCALSVVPAAAAALFSPVACVAIVAGATVVGGVKGKNKASEKFENDLVNKTMDHSVLEITLIDNKKMCFKADGCTFDIYEKCKELDSLFAVGKDV